MDTIAKSKFIILPLCLLPLVGLFMDVLANNLGPDPGRALTQGLGEWALRFLLGSLAITPMRKITGFGKLIRYRRTLGLFALFYAVLHMFSYLGFMLQWDWMELVEDLSERRYIIVGGMALSILIALGVTSTKSMMRKMGRSWKQLHKLIYAAAALAVVHYFWLVKSDYSDPGIYGVIFLILMLLRVPSFNKKPGKN